MFARKSSLFRGGRQPGRDVAPLFKERYDSFKAILDANSELLRMLSSVERMLEGRTLFGMAYVRSQAARSLFYGARMVQAYERLTGRAQPKLHQALEAIRERVNGFLSSVGHQAATEELILPHAKVGRSMVDSVGGKNANLGEMAGALGLNVPRGFALTTAAYQAFLAHNGLTEEIDKAQRGVDPDSPESLMEASRAIQALFLEAELPPELGQALDQARREIFHNDNDLLLALRSSAIGEDSELSFAGQYKSILGVAPAHLAESYKLVLASLFTPRAMSYRLSKGVPSEDTAMSVTCLEMVDSLVSGVAYSRDPLHPGDGTMVVNAVWGLGPYAVDGHVDPDAYRLSREDRPRLLESKTPAKRVMLRLRPGGGVEERAVPEDLAGRPCLSPEQAETLGRALLRLEEHFGTPQDVEWAVDGSGDLLFLQSRQLHLDSGMAPPPDMPLVSAPVLLSGATPACAGVACGPVRQVRGEDDLKDFPRGAVLVAEHSSPAYSLVMTRAAAVVTEHGSVTGHMASLAREYRLPALMGATGAMDRLEQDRMVTVEAWTGRVLDGRVEELLALDQEEPTGLMEGTPVHKALHELSRLLVPLNLTDPKSPGFAPEQCRTVHDVMRYVHEKCYQAMFAISDLASERGGMARRLEAPGLPLDLHVIDLGGGLSMDEETRKVRPEQVASIPFQSLLKGMLDERVAHREPRPVDMGGFFSVMARQMTTPEPERFGEKSYAIITDKYLNFSSRVGYHYGVLDAYCGQTVNSNYVNFQFKGGAADDVRRSRRARAIGLMLQGMGFSVEVEADMVKARFAKYEAPEIKERLEGLGRLLIYTRQMDMLMKDEGSVERLARGFLNGDFRHDGNGGQPEGYD